MKRTNKIRLTESQLHRVIKEAISTIVDEDRNDYRYVKGFNQLFQKIIIDDSDISVNDEGYLVKQPGNYVLYGTPRQGDFCTTDKPFGNYRDENGMEKPQLTESQLNKVIKESVKRVLKEIRLGDVELHGNNPEDWMAMRHVRSPYRMTDKGRRNQENARSLVDKEFSDFMTQPGNYTFPDVETKDKAQDRLSQIFSKGREKADSIKDSLKKVNAKQVEKMIQNGETFYVQHWQSNGYYPIYKLEYNEESGDYIRYSLKLHGWKHTSRYDSVDSLMYYLTHNACAISKNDFGKNTKQYPGSEDCVEIC